MPPVEDRAAVTYNTPRKFGDVRTCGFEDMLANRQADADRQWRRNYGGTGGCTLYPQVQDLYPLYPQVKDTAHVKILSNDFNYKIIKKVRTNLYPPLTKTFRRACGQAHDKFTIDRLTYGGRVA